MKVSFIASEAQYEPHEQTGVPPIPADQPAGMVVECGDYAQITYDTLRWGVHGADLARYSDGLWRVTADFTPIEASLLDGTACDPEAIATAGLLFTDIVFYGEES